MRYLFCDTRRTPKGPLGSSGGGIRIDYGLLTILDFGPGSRYLDQGLKALREGGDVCRDDLPDDVEIHVEIAVDETIPRGRDLARSDQSGISLSRIQPGFRRQSRTAMTTT